MIISDVRKSCLFLWLLSEMKMEIAMMASLSDQIEQLPPDIQQQVRDYAEFLLEKHTRKIKKKPTYQWAGSLKNLRDQYTSVELQHKIAEWRIGER
jgi:hypothetical protein